MSSQWIFQKNQWVKKNDKNDKNIMKITIDGESGIFFLKIDYSSAKYFSSRVVSNYTKSIILRFKDDENNKNYIINDDLDIVFAINRRSFTSLEIGRRNEKNVFEKIDECIILDVTSDTSGGGGKRTRRYSSSRVKHRRHKKRRGTTKRHSKKRSFSKRTKSSTHHRRRRHRKTATTKKSRGSGRGKSRKIIYGGFGGGY